MIDDTSIDIVISGLKGLYEKLAVKDKKKESGLEIQQQNESEGVWFESEKDKCLTALKDLFLYRMNANREKRIKQNSENICIRGVTRVFWVTKIMVFLSLEECMKMGQMCVYFNVLVRSPLFIKFMVQINERTKIDISLNTFETMEHKIIASHSRHKSHMPQDQKFKAGGGGIAGHFNQGTQNTSSQKPKEDNEAQMEVLKNVKIFLSDKIKKCEETIKSLQNEVEVLKNYLRIEKQINSKTKQLLSNKEKELDELRREYLDKEVDQRQQINDLSAKNKEKDKLNDELNAQKKTLKLHKKVLKEEVLRLRKELNEVEIKAHNKTVALKSLADFFNNQTLAKVRQMDPQLLDDE